MLCAPSLCVHLSPPCDLKVRPYGGGLGGQADGADGGGEGELLRQLHQGDVVGLDLLGKVVACDETVGEMKRKNGKPDYVFSCLVEH